MPRPSSLDIALVLIAFALTLITPFALIAILPLTFGIPHVLGDVRHLIVRRGLLSRPWLLLLAGLPMTGAYIGIGSILTAPVMVGAVLGGRATWLRKIPILLLIGFIGFGIYQLGSLGALIFLQVHNLVALLLWSLWPGGSHKRKILLMALVVLASLMVFSGLTDTLIGQSFAATVQGKVFADIASWFWLGDPRLSERLAAFFCFAQMMHYLVWLKWFPEDDQDPDKPRHFIAFTRDLGTPLMQFALMATLGLAIWGSLDTWAARALYLKLAAFHGYIEYAALALLATEGWQNIPPQLSPEK